jgi:hypothetical protein
METALEDKQDAISDLDAIRSGATAGNTALQPEDIDTLPTDGSSNPVSSGGTYNFVNSSIATNTAYFIGTFASVAELEAYTGTVTNNDYAFVTSTDSAGNTLYNRYKYNAATQTWSFEYAVNNTAFTAAQWAAIQSGMTSSDKTKLDGIEQGANKTVIDAAPTSGSSNAVSSGGVYTTLSGKQDIIADLSDIRSGASAGATAVQPSALTDYQTKLSGTNKLDPAYIEYDASHRAVSDTEKSTWNGKQDAISDLSTIRSGAAAGATALQQSDVTSTYSASGTAPVNGTAVAAALGSLDVASVGGTGKVISAISETDGKISATATTMDTTPTTNSQNPVTSGGVAASQAAQDAEIAVIVNAGAKNIQPVELEIIKQSTTAGSWSGNVYTESGSTYTINDDGTITVDTTGLTAQSNLFLSPYLDINNGKWVVSGCPQGGTSKTYYIATNSTSWGNPQEYGNGVELNIYNNKIRLAISVKARSGILVFRPMICTAADWAISQKYVPYALSNPTLTPALIKQIDNGAKNLLQFDETSTDNNNVRFTVNADGSITATQIAARTATAIFRIRYTDNLLSQDVRGKILSGCPSGGSDSTYKINIERRTSPYTNYGRDIGDGLLISNTIADDIPLYLYIQVYTTATLPLTFKPMICTAADYAVSPAFVPYRPSWQELTTKEQQNENNISKLTLDGNTKTGDLNDISVNEFAVYSSSSTHLPIPGYCFVRTSINSQSPSTSRLQEAFVMSTGASYVRTMSSGNWSNWLMITPNQ